MLAALPPTFRPVLETGEVCVAQGRLKKDEREGRAEAVAWWTVGGKFTKVTKYLCTLVWEEIKLSFLSRLTWQ